MTVRGWSAATRSRLAARGQLKNQPEGFKVQFHAFGPHPVTNEAAFVPKEMIVPCPVMGATSTRAAGLLACLLLVGCKPNESRGDSEKSATAPLLQTNGKTLCDQLRTCCGEVKKKLPADHDRDGKCEAWTRPNADNGGECGWGTECWCGAMLEQFRTSYGVCK